MIPFSLIELYILFCLLFYRKQTPILIQRLFDQAEIAKYSDAERRLYEASQKEYWDYTSTLETAERKGIQLGAFHEKIDTIHRLQTMGLSVEQIAQGAGMKVDEVRKLLQ